MSRLVQFSTDLMDALRKQNLFLEMESIYYAIESLTDKYNIVDCEIEKDLTNDLHNKIDMFITSKKIDGISKTTLKTYHTTLSIFAKVNKYKTSEITTQHIRQYISTMNETHKSSTVGSHISILRTFFAWLVNEKIILTDPMSRIITPKSEKRFPKGLELEQVELLREFCIDIRTRAIFELFYSTGARLSELVNAKLSDIDFQHRTLRVIGKGNKERKVYLNYKSIYHLKKYISARKTKSNDLFVINKSPFCPMKVAAIQAVFRKLGERANLPKQLHPHIMRHTLATHLLNNGAPISMVQKILGHESSSTTEIYCQLTDKNVQEQFDKFMPQ